MTDTKQWHVTVKWGKRIISQGTTDTKALRKLLYRLKGHPVEIIVTDGMWYIPIEEPIEDKVSKRRSTRKSVMGNYGKCGRPKKANHAT